MSITSISSDTVLEEIDIHFKVSAGPGAGKTYWLINHIKNILHNSDKLYKTRKIACITFTNNAVETIHNRLGSSTNQVEVSTIHSFLYNHIVSPYVSFIADEYDLNISEIDGHDDIILSNYGFLNEWKNRTGQQRIREDNIVADAFKKLKWKLVGGELKVKTPYPFKVGNYPIKNDSYFEYKKMTWEKGVIHHDDVLFFSYQILLKFPFVAVVLAAKFPYLLIDEFQDSNPIQIEIFKILASTNVKTGVIGDAVQSIYGFQGADYTQFQTFALENIKEYQLKENRRSSNEIVDLLNAIRTDIIQIKARNISLAKPTILIGDMTLALRKARALSGSDNVFTLSRDNITSNAMKAEINAFHLESNLLDRLLEVDKPSSGNRYRSKLILSCIKSVSFAKENKFKDAIKVLEKHFNLKKDKIKGRKKSLKFLSVLLDNFGNYKNKTLLEFALFIRDSLQNDLSNFRAGAIKTFYESYSFNQLALCVSIPEDISSHKTIHKAKGEEFVNVLLVLKEQRDIEFLKAPRLLEDEEHRINYVGVSRAKDNLFISVPVLSEDYKNHLKHLFEFIEV